MFEKPGISYAVMGLLFFLPQSMFVIGDYMAVGIRFPFFRIQVVTIEPVSGTTISKTFIITVIQELQYAMRGTVGSLWGRTALATYIWFAGLLLLFAAAAFVISWHYLDNPDHAKFIGPLLFIAGGLFLAWGLVQYGITFSGPSGYFIPVGVPILWYCGYQFMQDAKAGAEPEAEATAA